MTKFERKQYKTWLAQARRCGHRKLAHYLALRLAQHNLRSWQRGVVKLPDSFSNLW